MSAAAQTLFLPDDAATAALGATLAGQLAPGDLVVLEGDLGAGKTALARAIIRALVKDPHHEVPSPTFALVQPYQAGTTPILHADLYRLGDPDEIAELGLLDNPAAIVLVEWAARAPELLELATHTIALTIPTGGVGRNVNVVLTRR
ncbi:tRNA (adenosine(37)-N6)-threonylcarbamoyltransferase complex ATPase subunit type 1 TsaE [Devosia rhodophyticola]|uniref:tRNA threonylcarbamoyladenosine biosynthesis protein TsaE n=1 Tax=Devosia rhodophyticola TaxID=3026423 RepID=A0ABY7Z098_9HYPH|nr:tRNA (adenosine(37)-N6)-threonylcarbamoyltransferase complex ATPase subunit type 1 TsaE [Devosia rhodophyticola]WDR06916.1 tRNA (adenosine(37)-N6)-threonylcarbamoyltransferase complex ATPase subunit type 1 TsaE [Devosia rhodophyticola]